MLFFYAGKVYSQVPQQVPNKINKTGKREGIWIIWLNKNSRPVLNKDRVVYYLQISYQDGKPVDLVKDYYNKGKLIWEGYMVKNEPTHRCAQWQIHFVQ